MDNNLPNIENNENLMINKENSIDLSTASYWAKLMGIIGLVFAGAMFAFSIILFLYNNVMSMLGYGSVMTSSAVSFIIMAIVNCISYYFIYMFGIKIKKAITEKNQLYLNQVAVQLKNYLMINGVMLIIGVVCLIVVIMIVIMSLISLKSMM